MSCFEKKIKSAIAELVLQGDRILVAVSGGADSLALLYLLNRFSKELDYELFVAHLNHLSRGKESDGDADFVANVSDKLSLPCFIEKIDVAREVPRLKTSFQESARILRYQFLEKTLLSVKGNKIAVGHNAEDQAETVLMNLLRGTGLKGLGGIAKVRGHLIRPLLGFTRAELELFLNEQNLTYRTDSSNNQIKYLRNRIRHDLIPMLKTFNPDISANLVGLANIVREEDDWISEKAQVLFSQIVTCENGKRVVVLSDFYRLPLVMKRRLVREVLFELKADLRGITAIHVEQVLELFSHAKVGNGLSLPDNVKVVCGYEKMTFFLPDDLVASQIDVSDLKTTQLKVPGLTHINNFGIELHSQIIEPLVTFPEIVDGNEAYLDFEKTGAYIQVRFFQPGDRFVPLGMKGHKKLKSYYIDQKIPREQRSLIPILTNSKDEIIWVYGERISDPFRITDKTKKVLFIQGKRP
jgi:tRNA(Ile)-lysidine synthase